MFSLVLLVCLVAVATAETTTDDSSTSGLLERLEAGRKLVFDLGSAGTNTSSDEDDDDTLTSEASSSSRSSDTDARKLARKIRQENRANGIAAGKAAQKLLREQREPFQAVFRCAECADSGVLLGPVVIIAKSSIANVQADHFDQFNPDRSQTGPDGLDDVDQTLNEWQTQTGQASSASSNSLSTKARKLDEFLLQVRNRVVTPFNAGGSIKLQALIKTGNVKDRFGADSGEEATFGGANGKTLISPCIPIVNDGSAETGAERGFNLQIYGAARVGTTYLDGLFTIANSVDGNADTVALDSFMDAAGENFEDATQTFALTNFADDDDDTDGTVVDAATFGTVTFERCTAFSYFM